MIDRDQLWEIAVRFSPLTLAVAVGALTLSTAGSGQDRARPIAPESLAWTERGAAALAADQTGAASDAFETAAALDPANVRAFNGLAATAMAEGLPGKAIRFYREALLLDGRDRSALAGIGEAFAAKGAVGLAESSLAQLTTVCGAACPEVQRVQAALDRGTVTASAIESKPVIEQAN